MKYIKKYNESVFNFLKTRKKQIDSKEITDNLEDICLELQDIGLKTQVKKLTPELHPGDLYNIKFPKIGSSNIEANVIFRIDVWTPIRQSFEYNKISEVIERIIDYMKEYDFINFPKVDLLIPLMYDYGYEKNSIKYTDLKSDTIMSKFTIEFYGKI